MDKDQQALIAASVLLRTAEQAFRAVTGKEPSEALTAEQVAGQCSPEFAWVRDSIEVPTCSWEQFRRFEPGETRFLVTIYPDRVCDAVGTETR